MAVPHMLHCNVATGRLGALLLLDENETTVG
jgi:hypothetical protein